jgi:diketogulonate reductase-like aldo/keto reductase
VYDLCQTHNIKYQSFWTLTGSPTLLDFGPLKALAKRKGVTPEQALYRVCQL